MHLAGNLYKEGKAGEARLNSQGKTEEASRLLRAKAEETLAVCDDALLEAAQCKADGSPISAADDAQIHLIRAVALHVLKHSDEAIAEFRISIDKDGNNAEAHSDLAYVLWQAKKFDEARIRCSRALELKPEFPEAHRTMANILLSQGDAAGAEEHLRSALRFLPGDLPLREQLAQVLWKQGKFSHAVGQYQQVLDMQPENLDGWLNAARLLINDPRPEARFGAEARKIAQHVCDATGNKNIIALQVLAAACAETADFEQAEATIRKAMDTPEGKTPGNALVLERSLQAYQAHQKLIIKKPSP